MAIKLLRENLLKEAYKIIEKEGSEGLSIRKLSKSIGVSHNALYNHYKSKEELLISIAEEGYTKLGDIYIDISKIDNIDAFDRLKECTYAYIRFVIDNPNIYRTMVNANVAEMKRSTSFTLAAGRTYQTLINLAQEAYKEGRVKTKNVASVVNTAWGLGHGIAWLIIDQQLSLSKDLSTHPTVLLNSEEVSNKSKNEVEEVIRYSIESYYNGVEITL